MTGVRIGLTVLLGLQSMAASAQAPVTPPAPSPSAVPIPRTIFLSNMDAEFRKMDADKNNILTRKEIEDFQRMMAAHEASVRIQALFAQLDQDRNGQLSPGEFARLQTSVPTANAAPVLAQNDLNRDQQVTLVEYRTAKLANFDSLDSDKDGVVSVAEMRAGGIIR